MAEKRCMASSVRWAVSAPHNMLLKALIHGRSPLAQESWPATRWICRMGTMPWALASSATAPCSSWYFSGEMLTITPAEVDPVASLCCFWMLKCAPIQVTV